MTKLSPAAQAVFNAYLENCDGAYNEEWYKGDLVMIAAALRAASDQVISPVSPPCGDFDEYAQGFLAAHIKYRDAFLDIAAELESAQ